MFAIALLLFSAPVTALEAPANSTAEKLDRTREDSLPSQIDSLEVIAKYRFPKAETSSVVDVRWAGERSVYVLRLEHGVRVHELSPGLPGRELVLPGKTPGKSLHGGLFLAASSDRVIEGTPFSLTWRELDGFSGALADDFRADNAVYGGGGFAAIDISGDSLIALGYPRAQEYRESPETLLWSAEFDKGLREWEPLHRFDEAGDRKVLRSMQNAFRMMSASLCALDDGEIFVYPTFPARGLLFSRSGELKKFWDLAALKRDEGRLDTLEREKGDGDIESLAATWFSESRIVDDCFALGNTPALVVREIADGAPRWFVVALDTDEGTWYRVPVSGADVGWHFKADANDRGEIVLASSVRGRSAKSGGEELLLVLRRP